LGAAVAFETNFLSARTDGIYKVLFVDSGLDILRIVNWYQNQSATGTSASTGFTDNAIVQVVQKATAARGGTPPKILMSSWSPPAYLKSNGTTKGSVGTLSQSSAGAYDYAGLGDWWVRSLQAYAAQGVVPDYISIQNEPDYYNSEWKWTDPGWVRVDATPSLATIKASAFVSPDGTQLSVVLLDSDTADHAVVVSPGAFAYSTVAAFRTSGVTERAAQAGLGADGSIVLPSRSIATLIFGS
jgi:O-glycosyl hydrolase